MGPGGKVFQVRFHRFQSLLVVGILLQAPGIIPQNQSRFLGRAALPQGRHLSPAIQRHALTQVGHTPDGDFFSIPPLPGPSFQGRYQRVAVFRRGTLENQWRVLARDPQG